MVQIDNEDLKQVRSEFLDTPKYRNTQNTVMKNSIKKSITNQSEINSHSFVFSIDVDPQYYADDPHGVWNVPFFPSGSCDGKCADATDIENLNMWGIFGRADGEPFDAKDFMKQHPEWNWQKGYMYDRPSQPWTLFD